MADNKVTYGLKNAYYSKITKTTNAETGVVTITYGSPVAIPGSVSISLEPTGEDTPFFADDSIYFNISGASGYEGDYTGAALPRSFKKDIFGDIEDSNGALIEINNATKNDFAFMGEMSGDVGGQRFVFYNCSATRSSVSSNTVEETPEVQTQTITITAKSSLKSYTDLNNNVFYPVQAYLNVGDTGYDTFFSAVYEPTFTQDEDEDENPVG